jgi:SAM-dependent methyltransferase
MPSRLPSAQRLKALASTLPPVIRRRVEIPETLARRGIPLGRALNLGARTSTYGPDCVNLDLQPFPGVHVRADAHFLPFGDARFDTCILSGVLQYVRHPAHVAAEVFRVLRPGGHVVVDAPFVQPYCNEKSASDLWRFTDRGLQAVFAPPFEALSCEVAIGGGSALAYYVRELAGSARVRYASFGLQLVASCLVWPMAWWPLAQPRVAGAFLFVGRKPVTAASERRRLPDRRRAWRPPALAAAV